MNTWKRLLILFLACLVSAWVLSCDEGDDQDGNRESACYPPDDNVAADADADADADDDDLADDDDTGQLNDDSIAGDDDFSGCSNKGEIHEINWITIPEGRFMMGCSLGDEDCKPEEYPLHPVRISSFQMTESEITQFQFEEIMGYNPTNFDICDNCPVDGVDFSVSSEFCELIGGRLPTEAEWEYAARAGSETKYYCGNEDGCLDDIAWYESNSEGKPHEVCAKEANSFGIYDILGNLHEYTSDNCYEYTEEEEVDPSHPEDGQWLVLRGAGWASPSVGMRVSYRHQADPDPYDVDGVRCARDIE